MQLFKLFGSILIDNKEANESLRNTDREAEGVGNKLEGVTKAAGAMALGLASAGAAALAALGVKAVGAADDFQKAMNNLQTETGATNEDMVEFEDIATRIYNNNFGEDFQDIADSMAEVSKNTGLAGEELERATTNAIMLRDTFEYEVNDSTRTASTLMKQFGITSDQAYTLIAQGAQNGADKNGDLLDTLNEYSPQFKALGFSAEDFTSILIQGAEDGAWSIDKVGDAIKEFTIRSKDLSKTSLEAFEALELNGEEMSRQFAAGGESAQEAFQTVMQKLGELEDPLERNAVGVALFGTQFEDLEADAILALGNVNAQANMNADTLTQINDVKYDSLGEAIQGIGRNFETGLLIPLGEKIIPKLEEFAGWIVENMPEIQANIEKAMDVAINLFEGLANGVQWVIDNMNILLPVIAAITGAVVAQMVINGLVQAYKAWQTATKTQTTLQWLLNAALNANPLGLVALAIGAVIAAGVLLWQNWDTVKEKAGQFWTAMKEVFGKIKGFVIGVWDDIKSKAKEVFEWIQGKIDWVTEKIDKVKNLGSNIGDGISDTVSGWVSKIPGFADGTDSAPGGLALVGERGPELVELPRGSKVNTAEETKELLDNDRTIVVESKLYVDGREVAATTSKPMKDRADRRARGQGVYA